jgi:hypothetical protein
MAMWAAARGRIVRRGQARRARAIYRLGTEREPTKRPLAVDRAWNRRTAASDSDRNIVHAFN